MTRSPRRLAGVSFIAASCIVMACGRASDNSALSKDTALSRDLARAGSDSTAQPQLKDTAVTPPSTDTAATPPAAQVEASEPPTRVAKAPPKPPEPTATAVAPAPKSAAPAPPAAAPPEQKVEVSHIAPAPVTASYATGKEFDLVTPGRVCTNTSHVGDRFTATLSDPDPGAGPALPPGSTATVEVTHLHGSQSSNDQIEMGFRIVEISVGGRTYNPDADVVSAPINRISTTTDADNAKKVAGGAVIGAILGQVIGHKAKGTIIGAVAGGAAGGAVAAATQKHEGCVETGSTIKIHLNQPLTVTIS